MPAVPADLAATLAAERGRLIGLCAHLTGDPQAAEDLAQETLVEAWRHSDRLRDPSEAAPWLSAIARHVCRRWARRRGRDARAVGPLDAESPALPAADLDLEADLERDELARLLDRALARLPVDTRAALVARYVEETPQAEVALRLGLSAGAVAMRLQRGKLALRRALATELRAEAEAYGFVAGTGRWVDTQLWCPLCGRLRLRGHLVGATGEFTLRCPACTPAPRAPLSQATMPLLHRGTATPRAGATRLRGWLHERYWQPALGGLVRCTRCERALAPQVGPNTAWGYAPQLRHSLVTACDACGERNAMWLATLAFGLPEGKAFWRAHPRLRLLPERDIERDGRPAVLVGFESMTGAPRLEAIVRLGPGELLACGPV